MSTGYDNLRMQHGDFALDHLASGARCHAIAPTRRRIDR